MNGHKFLWVLLFVTGLADRVDAQSSKVTWVDGIAPGCSNIFSAAVDSHGGVVAYLQCVNSFFNPIKPKLWLIDVDGTKRRQVSTLTFNLATFLRVSNGGQKIAYISGHTFDDYYVWSDVYVVDGATGATMNLTGPTGGHVIDQMDMTADGSKIVYDRYDTDPAKFGTFVMNSDGTGNQKISNYTGENSISGDGSTVAMSIWDGGERRIVVMNSDGTNPRVIPTPEDSDTQPWLNHDGSLVTMTSYNENDGLHVRCYSAKSDGTNVTLMSQDVIDAQVCGNGEWVLLATAFPGSGSPDPARIHPDGTGKEVFFSCGGTYNQRRFSHNGTIATFTCATEPGVTAGLHIADWNLPNLKLVGVPKVGAPISLVLNGTSGQPFLWFLSLGAASLPMPPYGTFGIDPSTLSVLVGGVLGSNGKYSISATLPSDPILVGAHAYLQAVSGAAPLVLGGKLSNALDLEIEG